jgi:hypothetical protein
MWRTWNINVEPDFSWNTAHCMSPLLRVSNFQFHAAETCGGVCVHVRA